MNSRPKEKNVSILRPKKKKGKRKKQKEVVLSSRPKKEGTSRVRDQKKFDLNSRPKNGNVSSLRTEKEKKGKILSSRLKESKNFISKKGFFYKVAGNEIPQFGEYVYNTPELWKVISKISPGMYRVDSCLSWTRKMTTSSFDRNWITIAKKTKEATKRSIGKMARQVWGVPR